MNASHVSLPKNITYAHPPMSVDLQVTISCSMAQEISHTIRSFLDIPWAGAGSRHVVAKIASTLDRQQLRTATRMGQRWLTFAAVAASGHVRRFGVLVAALCVPSPPCRRPVAASPPLPVATSAVQITTHTTKITLHGLQHRPYTS